MQNFHPFSASDLHSRVRIRAQETKLGQRVVVRHELDEKSPLFVLFGVKEDLGVKANYGVGGAGSAWESFLDAFLNVQDTPFLRGESIQILGHFDFSTFEPQIEINSLRQQVERVDAEVAALVSRIVSLGKIPLIIGGSHAGAYANLLGTTTGLRKHWPKTSVNCINLDAHSDYRIVEGRHSGNGFRYAQEEGFLHKYAIVGLHENYTPENVLQDLEAHPRIHFSTWEDIFLREKFSFAAAVDQAISFTQSHERLLGVELDVDCIENVLSSAMTPTGLSTQQARYFLYQTAQRCNVAYLHICEAATVLENGLQNRSTGKLLSYLVSDFVKGKVRGFGGS